MNTRKLITLIFICLSSLSIFAQIDSGYVEIKGGKLFYRIWGEGKPLLFLNGGPGFSSDGYEMYAKELSKNRQVILFDQRGTGQSKLSASKIDYITINQMIKDIEKLRAHLKIEKWDVMGHSFGGKYAMHYISKYGEAVNKLILSASPSYKRIHWQEFKKISLNKLTPTELSLLEMQTKEYNKKNPSSIRLYKIDLALKGRFYVKSPMNYAIASDWFLNKSNPNPHVFSIVSTSIQSTKIKKKKLASFENPVLIIHSIGDFLNILNPKDNLAIFPNAKLKMISDSGHMMLLDQKKNYLKAINDFLQ